MGEPVLAVRLSPAAFRDEPDRRRAAFASGSRSTPASSSVVLGIVSLGSKFTKTYRFEHGEPVETPDAWVDPQSPSSAPPNDLLLPDGVDAILKLYEEVFEICGVDPPRFGPRGPWHLSAAACGAAAFVVCVTALLNIFAALDLQFLPAWIVQAARAVLDGMEDMFGECR